MSPRLFLAVWVGAHAAQIALGIAALQKPAPLGAPRVRAWVWVSGIASVVPLLALVLFVLVFVVGGASNVAQMSNGDEQRRLWSLWVETWPMLLLGCPASLAAQAFAAALPPYPPAAWCATACRVCGVIAACGAWYGVMTWFPDA